MKPEDKKFAKEIMLCGYFPGETIMKVKNWAVHPRLEVCEIITANDKVVLQPVDEEEKKYEDNLIGWKLYDEEKAKGVKNLLRNYIIEYQKRLEHLKDTVEEVMK